VKPPRLAQFPLAPRPRPSGKLVAFRDGGKDAGPRRGEQVLDDTVIGARVAPDVEQPEDPGEAHAIERPGDERAELAALRLPRLGVSVPRQAEEVVAPQVIDGERPGLAGRAGDLGEPLAG